MIRKWVKSLLLLFFLIFTALQGRGALALDADSVPVELPYFPVTLNGQTFSDSYSKYPLLVYKDITYFPMTCCESRLLGLNCDWSEEDGLVIEKRTEDFDEYIHEIQPTKNKLKQRAQIAAGKITVNGKQIVNTDEPYPLLRFRDVIYFPLTWRFMAEEFGWDYSFSIKDGLVLSNPDVSLRTQAEFNGLVDYGFIYMGTGTLDFPCFFHAETVDVNGFRENPEISFLIYNHTGKSVDLLPADFSWEYQIYYVAGKQKELVYRKAIPFYSGELAPDDFAMLRIADEYWQKSDFLKGEYEFVLVHPAEYKYQFIDGDGQILTAPTEQMEAYSITFSERVTVD